MTSEYATIQRASKKIGDSLIFSNVSFVINKGEMIALTGRSGSGKTTLLNCLGCLSTFDGADYCVEGHNIGRMNSKGRRRFRRDHLGYLFQNYALVDGESVAENIVSPLKVLPRARRPSKKDLSEVLYHVGLADKAQHKVYQLSGGEQQRVALASLMLKKPRLILADEPTGALDFENAEMVMDSLRQMAASGASVVIATHSKAIVDKCDHVLNIEDYK